MRGSQGHGRLRRGLQIHRMKAQKGLRMHGHRQPGGTKKTQLNGLACGILWPSINRAETFAGRPVSNDPGRSLHLSPPSPLRGMADQTLLLRRMLSRQRSLLSVVAIGTPLLDLGPALALCQCLEKQLVQGVGWGRRRRVSKDVEKQHQQHRTDDCDKLPVASIQQHGMFSPGKRASAETVSNQTALHGFFWTREEWQPPVGAKCVYFGRMRPGRRLTA